MTLPPRLPGPGDPWPTVSDQPPGPFTGVPVERDPRTGRVLSGDPGGRSDKGRSTRPTRVIALATAGALVVAAAVVVLLVVNRGDDTAPAAASTTSAAPTTTTPTSTTPPPPVDPGPRTVPVTLTTVSVTPPPGFPPDATFGTVGEVRARTWTLTGPCDGTGACTVEHCTAPGTCLPPLVASPNGTGYVATVVIPVNWASPNCTGGEITDTVTFTVTGDPSAPQITGDWVENASPLQFTGANGTPCGIYLAHYSLASA